MVDHDGHFTQLSSANEKDYLETGGKGEWEWCLHSVGVLLAGLRVDNGSITLLEMIAPTPLPLLKQELKLSLWMLATVSSPYPSGWSWVYFITVVDFICNLSLITLPSLCWVCKFSHTVLNWYNHWACSVLIHNLNIKASKVIYFLIKIKIIIKHHLSKVVLQVLRDVQKYVEYIGHQPRVHSFGKETIGGQHMDNYLIIWHGLQAP